MKNPYISPETIDMGRGGSPHLLTVRSTTDTTADYRESTVERSPKRDECCPWNRFLGGIRVSSGVGY